ncbi:hypothetical protein LJC56_10085 [Christensenellaceae bacterium OttesenSCG-928-K19]|nr:hypothetical protein [Christensenellaceae bacterium OttesenSCG-928-K19]
MKKIYVASSWRNDIQPNVVKYLREQGFDVYDFKNPAEGNQGFLWSEIDADWKRWNASQFIEALEHPIAKDGFQSDMLALATCDVCVLVLPCGRSAHLEAGYAAGCMLKRLLIYIPEEAGQQEPELMYKMADGIFMRLEDVAAEIEKVPEKR